MNVVHPFQQVWVAVISWARRGIVALDWPISLSDKRVVFSLLLTGLAVAVTFYLIYKDHIREPDHQDEQVNEEKFPDLDDHSRDNDSLSSLDPDMRGRPSPYSQGKTDKYSFSQTDSEMEVYVPLDLSSVAKRDVQVLLCAGRVTLTVRGEVVLAGKLWADIVPLESNWQILDEGEKKTVWISLYKRNRTDEKEYWRDVLQ
jgi:CS domain